MSAIKYIVLGKKHLRKSTKQFLIKGGYILPLFPFDTFPGGLYPTYTPCLALFIDFQIYLLTFITDNSINF